MILMFFIGLASLALIDGIWLTLMAGFFSRNLVHLMKESASLPAGIAAWILIALDVICFVLPKK